MKTIDIHVHGIGGYDTRTTDEEDILKIAGILGSYGVSEFIPTIYSAPIKVMRENMKAIKKAMEKQHSAVSGQPSARIIGLHLEGPFLNPSRCGSIDAATLIILKEKNLTELTEGFEDIIKIITIAPEREGAVKFIKKMSEKGIVVSMGHSDATFSEAEAGFHAGAKGITHIFNAMRSFHHREPGIAGFGLTHQDIYVEIIADPFHLHPKTLELIFRTKNPERIIIISDSVKEAPSPQALTDSKGKLLGGSMTITESSKRLVQMGFDEKVIESCISINPSRYSSLSHGL